MHPIAKFGDSIILWFGFCRGGRDAHLACVRNWRRRTSAHLQQLYLSSPASACWSLVSLAFGCSIIQVSGRVVQRDARQIGIAGIGHFIVSPRRSGRLRDRDFPGRHSDYARYCSCRPLRRCFSSAAWRSTCRAGMHDCFNQSGRAKPCRYLGIAALLTSGFWSSGPCFESRVSRRLRSQPQAPS